MTGLFTKDSIVEYERSEIGKEAISTMVFPASEVMRTFLGVLAADGVGERVVTGVEVD